MREIEVENGVKIVVRGLTRKEVKKLKKDGFDLMEPSTDRASAEKQVDTVIAMAVPKEQIKLLDDMEFRFYRHTYQSIMKETFGSVEEEKNLPAT